MLKRLGIDQECDRQTDRQTGRRMDCSIVLKSWSYTKPYSVDKPISIKSRSILRVNGRVAQVPFDNALVLDNLCEYHNKSYCYKLDSTDYIYVADSVGLSSTLSRNRPQQLPRSVK